MLKKILKYTIAILVASLMTLSVFAAPAAISVGEHEDMQATINKTAFEGSLSFDDSYMQVVRTPEEFHTAITSSTITEIYMAADITIGVSGLTINADKPYLIISGKNPYPDYVNHPDDNPSATHVLTDYNMATGLIYPLQLTTGIDVTFQDISIKGRNNFGIVTVRAAGATVTFKNMTFEGRRLIRHDTDILISTVRIVDSLLTLDKYDQIGQAKEIAEIANVTLGGNVTIFQNDPGNVDAIFWLRVSGGRLTLEDGANIKVINNSTHANPSFVYASALSWSWRMGDGARLYYEGDNYFQKINGPTSFSMGDGAVLDVNLRKMASSIEAPFSAMRVNGDLSIPDNAVFRITAPRATSVFGLLRVNGDLRVGENTVFSLTLPENSGSTFPLILIEGSGRTVSFNNPREALLLNNSGRIFSGYTSAFDLNISTQQINNWWSNASNGTRPSYGWRKSDGQDITLSGRIPTGIGNISSIVSNYIAPDDATDIPVNNDVPSPASFDTTALRIISFGSFTNLTAEYYYSEAGNGLAGKTLPWASVYGLIRNEGDSEFSVIPGSAPSIASPSGDYMIDVPNDISGKLVKTIAFYNYLITQTEPFGALPTQVKVSFNANNGEAPVVEYVNVPYDGAALLKEPEQHPEKEGYSFKGWWNIDFTRQWDFGSDTVSSSDVNGGEGITLYAKWDYRVRMMYLSVGGNQLHSPLSLDLPQNSGAHDLSAYVEAIPGYRADHFKRNEDTQENVLEDLKSISIDAPTTISVFYAGEQISVEVPIQLLWAAFSSDNGSIVSPEYQIVNRSESPVRVSLHQLETTENMGGIVITPDTPVSDNQVRLDMRTEGAFANSIHGIIPDTVLTSGNVLGTLHRDMAGSFTIGGIYSGSFTKTPRQLKLLFSFKFELIT